MSIADLVCYNCGGINDHYEGCQTLKAAAPVPASTGREPEADFSDWMRRRGLLGVGASPERIFFAGHSYGRRGAASELDADAERLKYEAFAKGWGWPVDRNSDGTYSGHGEACWMVWQAAIRSTRATAESAPRTFEQWWTEPTPTTAAPYTFMDEKSARAAWFASRNAAESAPATAAPREAEKEPEPSPLYFKALGLVNKARYASVSMVQRRLRIGWSEARDFILLMVDRREIPEAWLPPAALIGRFAPSNSPVGAKEQDK